MPEINNTNLTRQEKSKINKFKQNKCLKIVGPSTMTKSKFYESISKEYKEKIMSVTEIRDSFDIKKIAYLVVVFTEHDIAKNFVKEYSNKLEIDGQKLSIFFKMTPEQRDDYKCNTFIRGIRQDVDYSKVLEICDKYGVSVSIKLGQTKEGKRLGYGFAQFVLESQANNFMQHADEIKKELGSDDVEFKIVEFVPKRKLWIYFSGFKSKDNIESMLKENGQFSEPEKNFKIFNAADRKKKEDGTPVDDMFYGFVKFENTKDAIKTIKTLNGKVLEDGSKLNIQFTKTRKEILRERAMEKLTIRQNLQTIYKDCNLLVTHLSLKTNDELIKEFEKYGKIYKACYKWNNGMQTDTAFVCFIEKQDTDKVYTGIKNGELNIFGAKVSAEHYIPRTERPTMVSSRPFTNYPDNNNRKKETITKPSPKQQKVNKPNKPKPSQKPVKQTKPIKEKVKEEFDREKIGEIIYDCCEVVMKIDEDLSSQITGVLLESLQPEELMKLVNNKAELKKTINEAKEAVENAKINGGL